MKKGFLFAIFLLWSGELFAESSDPSDQPVSHFSNLPTGDYRLSPSGERIGYFVPLYGRQTLVVHKLDGTERRIVPPWDDKIELVSFFWKSEEIVVFQVYMTLKRFQSRVKSSETRQISFDIAANKARWLGKPRQNAMAVRNFPSQFERVVDRMLDDPDHILLELDFDLDGYPTLYRVNVKTGSRKIAQKQKTGTYDWFTDDNGVVRLGLGFRGNRANKRVRYLNDDGRWKELSESEALQKYKLVDLGSNTGEVYMTGTNEHGTNSLFLVNVLTGEVLETLFSNAEVDIDDTVRHPTTGKVVGVEYTDDFKRVKYFDEDLKTVQLSLERALPGYVVSISHKARDENLYLISAHNDTDPGQYFIYKRDEGKLDYFASSRPEIKPDLSASTRRVDIPVSDGSMIPGYLTLPNGVEAKSLPVVVLPHPGLGRDSAVWDFAAQFAASRGYAVLKPNYRGSSGYGLGFRNKGVKQWGGLMQQDITDATRWLIEQGIADPERICIGGVSYGGYAAMMGLIQQPDLYACGISINGVMDLPSIKSADQHYIGGRNWVKTMGLEGVKDKEVSPQHQAEHIKVPVLLVAAKNDARISYRQTARFHRTLRKMKKESTYVEIETGTHYMLNRESRHAWLSAAEEFLAEHLK